MGLLLDLAGSVGIWGAGRLLLDSSVIPTCSLLLSLNTWKDRGVAMLQYETVETPSAVLASLAVQN